MQDIKIVPIDSIKLNDKNPRKIKEHKFNKLIRSIQNFPEMMEIRPIVVDENNMILGGNMRYKACVQAGLKEIPIIKAENLNEEQKKEFILKDNNSFGDWDLLTLADFDKDILLNSGFENWELVDIFGINELGSKFTGNIEGSNFNPDLTNIDDYIKQNIFFLNEMMIEFEDVKIKEAIKNIDAEDQEFIEDIKKVILKHGKDTL